MPVLRQLSFFHCFPSRVTCKTLEGLDGSADLHRSFHLFLSWACLGMSAGAMHSGAWACKAKGRRGLRCVHYGVPVTTLWRRWSSLSCAFRERANVAASPLTSAGVMPANTGSWLTGMAHRLPDMVHRTPLSAVTLNTRA